MFSFSINDTRKAIWILLVCGFIQYANTLGHDFNIDDTYYTGGNSLTERGWSSIPEIFSIPTIYGPRGIGYDYRPVAATSFIIQHQLFGTGAAMGHFINLCIYLLTVVVLFRLLTEWVQAKAAINLAFWISLLFLVHPLHTEVVANIKSRDELLALLFCLLTLRFWVFYFKKKKIYLAFLAPVFFALALFSKYTILPFILFIPLALYFFYQVKGKGSLLVLTALLITATACHLLKSSILPPFDHYFSITENGLVKTEYGMGYRISTSFYVMGRYLLLHVFPVKLVYYYGYRYVPVVGWENLLVIFSFLFHMALFVWCFLNRQKKSLLLFGVLFYLGNMIIYSNLVELAPGMMSERFTYAASIGFCIAFVSLAYQYLDAAPVRMKPGFLLALVVLMFGVRTLVRNRDWKDKETLYAHDVRVAPQSAMVNYLYGDWLLASALEERKEAITFNRHSPLPDQQINNKIRESKDYFNRSLEINPLDTLAQYNLASAHIQLDEFKEAESVLTKTLKQFPQYAEARFTLGVSQVYQKNYTAAINNFQKLLQIDPNFIIGYEQLNRAQLAIGDTAAALYTLNKGMHLNPSSPVPLAEMANYWLGVKDTVKAVQFAEKAAQLPPSNQGLLLFLRNYFFVRGEGKKADYYQNLLLRASSPL